MTDGAPHALAHWLWDGILGLMTLALMGVLALSTALGLGWNTPRPTHSPDWRAPGLPLHLQAKPDETVVTLMGWPAGDFTLEAEAIPLCESGSAFNSYGLVYRAQDVDHYYVFAVSSDGYYAILQITGGQETPLVDWQQFPHVRRGEQANRLRITCAGSICHFYVNDEYATTVEDTAWLTGDVGLWVSGFGDEDAVIQFKHVYVWKVAMDKGRISLQLGTETLAERQS